ncbi:MAG: biotin/lipoyl-containing protein [Chloroflexota bacterium]|jgi:biotin carboxyl carrier protein|nr:biotin/lipoyl-containing protein [Chloroflexota bacterium]
MTNLRELLDDLIARVCGSDIAELEVRKQGVRIAVRRRGSTQPVVTPGDHASQSLSAGPGPGETDIISPLNGIFYAAASPGEAAFAEVGHHIESGQVVGLVEAMKVFNEILSEVSGTIVDLLAADGGEIQEGDAVLRVRLDVAEPE